MTPKQVLGFLADKSKDSGLVGLVARDNINTIQYYKDLGYDFRCEKDKLIAFKQNEDDVAMEFGDMLQQHIELNYNEDGTIRTQ